MSISISSSLPAAPVAVTNSSAPSAAAQQAQPTQTQQTTKASADTVRLSESQQVYQLYNQGEKISQIASNLSLTVSAVNSFLGISDTTS
jgi:DNA-binding NarL/FixJ family response regulator